MTSRLLQTSLSTVATRRTQNLFPLFNPHQATIKIQNKTKGMPVIHAVAAHRRCHTLCHHPHLVPEAVLKNEIIYVNSCSKPETTIKRSMNLELEEPFVEICVPNIPKQKPIGSPTMWLKSRTKSFLSSGKNILGLNLFDPCLHDSENEIRRPYSKTKDKGGDKKKKVIVINEVEMNEVISVEALKSQLELQLKHMKDEYASHLSIRGAAGALELLEVEFEGEKYPLQELAQIGRKNPQLAVLNLASLPDACQPVLKAIQESGMQLNPQQEGTTIYIPLPKITREHRENLAKNAKLMFTKYKTSLQGVQNRFIKQCKSNDEVSEDTIFSTCQQIMRMTENYIAEAEKIMHDKQKELLDTTS